MVRWYQVAQDASDSHVVGRVTVDGSAVLGSQHLFGDVRYGTTGTMIVQELSAGSHTFAPQYRQPGTVGELISRNCFLLTSFSSYACRSHPWQRC